MSTDSLLTHSDQPHGTFEMLVNFLIMEQLLYDRFQVDLYKNILYSVFEVVTIHAD